MRGSVLGDERGSATILACFAILAILAVTVLTVQVGAVVSVRHRAQSAADLAALAAAGALNEGNDSACAAADEIAARMAVSVESCAIDGWDVVVTVTARAELLAFGAADVEAVARAGPAETEPGAVPAAYGRRELSPSLKVSVKPALVEEPV